MQMALRMKAEQEPSRRRLPHRTDDWLATLEVKQEPLSPEPVAHRLPDAPASASSRGSPGKRKNQSSGRRSQSSQTKRSRSSHYSAVREKQEREDHPRGGPEHRQHQQPSERLQRRAGSRERDQHQGRSRQRRSWDERPGQGRDGDSQKLQAQEEERAFQNAMHRQEHGQQKEGAGGEAQEVIPRPAANRSKEVPVKEKRSLELSGTLLEDTNTFRGVVIKYSEPPEARIPKKRWRLYPFKNDDLLPVMYIHRQSAYLLGRDRLIADIPIDHPSCSKQHAVFQYRLVEHTRADGTVGLAVKPYIIDLGSSNGTFLNYARIEPQRYYELKEKDVLKFGFSSREYVLLHESSDTSEADRKEDEEEEEEEEMVSHG
ncbi:smad nuclear interacting protein 1-like [Peromyscus californicus insignis]|uniref:smad nuclear interacting protein 1-like n=1 Tax=Peromyscus californicus insignis TaxID=564181 RepID=UPI0022A7C751|nr:smad nuclear interacting protein 1-like [Peromyscus californicus insignis]